MKAIFSLGVLCYTLALCNGYCTVEQKELEFKDGEFFVMEGCVDSHDGTEHPAGSAWNTADCMRCECTKDAMSCCSRYGGVAEMDGCNAVRDPETCTFKFYKNDDPSVQCL